MQVNAATINAYDHIAARAADVNAAFSPGAAPAFDDVATAATQPQLVLDPLSAAAPNDAYFVTRDARGRLTYTKDGSFHIKDGTLCGANGTPILGYADNAGALREVHLDSIDVALGRTQNIRVDPQGRVLYDRTSVDPKTGRPSQETVVAGRVALARFAAGTRTQAVDATHVTLPDGVVPHYGRAGDGNFATLSPFHRTTSSIDLDASLSRLKDAYLAFDALQAANKAQGKTGKTAMDLVK